MSNLQKVENIENKVNETKAQASTVSSEFQRFLTDIEELVGQATSMTGEDLVRVKNKLNERINLAKVSLNEISDTLVQKARNGAVATNNYVHEQPWTAVGAGAAIGLLVGLLVSRRD